MMQIEDWIARRERDPPHIGFGAYKNVNITVFVLIQLILKCRKIVIGKIRYYLGNPNRIATVNIGIRRAVSVLYIEHVFLAVL